MPSIARFQKSGVCTVCGGALWFYPAPVADPAADDPNGEIGSWAHLAQADWVDDPHEPVPAEPEES